MNSQKTVGDDLPGPSGALDWGPTLAGAAADAQGHSRFEDVQNPAIAVN